VCVFKDELMGYVTLDSYHIHKHEVRIGSFAAIQVNLTQTYSHVIDYSRPESRGGGVAVVKIATIKRVSLEIIDCGPAS